MRVPTNFKYATTIGFWVSLFSLLLDSSIEKKIILSYSFSISVCGILMQIFENNNKSIIQNIVDYGIPLMISLSNYKFNNKYELSIILFVPMILYHLYAHIYKIDLNKQYKNFYKYNILNLILITTYFNFK
tara:strand:- start:1592 stop:1984 length:393 start_codon:yes stop_codon:yes gene_type:complete